MIIIIVPSLKSFMLYDSYDVLFYNNIVTWISHFSPHLTSPHLVPSVALPSKGPQLPLLGPPAKQGLGRFLGPLNEAQQIHKGKGLMDRIWDIIWYNWD
jgi:hypothetical protein